MPSSPWQTCPLCLEAGASLRTDKKGRPYVVCGMCRSRMFVGSLVGLTWFRAINETPSLSIGGKSLGEVREAARAKLDRERESGQA